MSAPPLEEPSGEHRADSAGAGQSAARADADEELAALRERIINLESELDRKEAQLDAVRRRYEAILEDRSAEREAQSGLLSLLR